MATVAEQLVSTVSVITEVSGQSLQLILHIALLKKVYAQEIRR